MFLGEYVLEITNVEGEIQFMTITGAFGEIVTNFKGNMEILVNDECIYEIESDLYPVITNGNDRNLFNLYNYIKDMDVNRLKHRSKVFLDVVTKSIEKILINNNLPIAGRTIIGGQEVIYQNNKKIIISLN